MPGSHQRMAAALLVSAFFHAAFVAGLWHRFWSPARTPQDLQPIEVQYNQTTNADLSISSKPPGPASARQPKASTRNKTKAHAPIARDSSEAQTPGIPSSFRPSMRIPSAGETALNPERDAEARGSGEWPEDQWGRSGGQFGQIQNFLRFDRLRDEARGLLNYPSILARRGIHGTVNARLRFTEDSQCDWTATTITSHERHLGIYVIALLKKLCNFEVVKIIKAKRTDFVDFSFQFDLVDELTPDSLRRNQDFIVGNVIGFRRTEQKSVFEYQLGPLRGLWFVPAVQLDFPWIIEKWDQYVNGIDPMAAFK